MEVINDALVRERLEYYADTIKNIIKNCPIIWFRFGNQDLETKLDTVDYADIDILKRNSQRLAVANYATTIWIKVVILNRCGNCNSSKPLQIHFSTKSGFL